MSSPTVAVNDFFSKHINVIFRAMEDYKIITCIAMKHHHCLKHTTSACTYLFCFYTPLPLPLLVVHHAGFRGFLPPLIM